MQHPLKFTLVMSRGTDNGQWVALIIHVSINCHFVALPLQRPDSQHLDHSCTFCVLCEVARRISSFLFGLSGIRMINPSVLAWSVFMRNLLWLIYIFMCVRCDLMSPQLLFAIHGLYKWVHFLFCIKGLSEMFMAALGSTDHFPKTIY